MRGSGGKARAEPEAEGASSQGKAAREAAIEAAENAGGGTTKIWSHCR